LAVQPKFFALFASSRLHLEARYAKSLTIMARTRTGSFPIGFRCGRSDWQKNLADVIAFAKDNGFEGIDLGDLPADQIKPVLTANLRIGSVDMKQPWSAIASADAGKRKDAVAVAADHIKSIAALGVRNFFTVIFPDNDAGDRKQNFKLAVDGYSQLAESIAATGARIVIEGYPGSYPYYPALCCTPESLRAFLKEAGSKSLAINYDPSHLIKMGIDPARFLEEFAAHVGHVHAKDTQIIQDSLYEFGNLQPATFAQPHHYGGFHWRYCIPGHGKAPWPQLLSLLQDAKYDGIISVELEDENFNGAEAGEKRGLLASRDFLIGV
jgi:sugar phosphate isomerase/epimerase